MEHQCTQKLAEVVNAMGARISDDSNASCCSGSGTKCRQYWIDKDAPDSEPASMTETYASPPTTQASYDVDVTLRTRASNDAKLSDQRSADGDQGNAFPVLLAPNAADAQTAHSTDAKSAENQITSPSQSIQPGLHKDAIELSPEDTAGSPSVFDTLGSNMSLDSTFSRDVDAIVQSDAAANLFEDITMEEAKTLVKPFIKRMVKGATMDVMVESGQLKTCSVTLGRKLNYMKVKLNETKRKIEMRGVAEVIAGSHVEGITTPLDDLCATLVLASGECITFRCADAQERDTLTMCLTIFSACAE